MIVYTGLEEIMDTHLDLRSHVIKTSDGIPINLAHTIDPVSMEPWKYGFIAATQPEIVFSNRLRCLVSHIISGRSKAYATLDETDAQADLMYGLPARREGLWAVAEAALANLLVHNNDRIDGLTELEMLALMRPPNELNGWLREHKITEWDSPFPLHIVVSNHHFPIVPTGNVVTLDATSDLTFLQSTDAVHLIRFVKHFAREEPEF